MIDDTSHGDPKELIEARRALTCLYIAVEESVARDLEQKVEAAFTILSAAVAGAGRTTEAELLVTFESAVAVLEHEAILDGTRGGIIGRACARKIVLDMYRELFVAPSGTTEAEPDAWQIIGDGKPLGTVHLTEKSVQGHVNELNTNPQSRGGNYTYRALYAAGGVSEDTKDAERWRAVRSVGFVLRASFKNEYNFETDWWAAQKGTPDEYADALMADLASRSHEAR